MKIGIFDSGVGGLTILKELIRKNKYHEYIYIGDTKNLPYGNSTIENLKKYSDTIINYFIKKRCDLVIIACGTISSNLSNYLKEKHKIKIIDIITPTIDYIVNKNYKNIGLIATNMTIQSNKIASSLTKHNINVITNPAPKLVDLIEKNLMNKKESVKILKEYLAPFQNKNLDLLILGCTHYPIIKKQISSLIKTQLYDMAYPISSLIEDGTILKVQLYFTKLNNDILKNVINILNCKYKIEELKL